jgi:hypothetical protein
MIILITAFPKSGSTFLRNVLTSLLGCETVVPVPGRERREQELSRSMLATFSGGTGVAHTHTRASRTTEELIAEFGIRPIVLVRDLHDALLSLADHLRTVSPRMPMAYFDETLSRHPLSDRVDAVVELAAPWYVNFYVSWWKSHPDWMVRYEDAILGGPAGIASVLDKIGVRAGIDQVERSIAAARGMNSRFNVGEAGRGVAMLTADNKTRLARLASFYPDVDFRPIGLGGLKGQTVKMATAASTG